MNPRTEKAIKAWLKLPAEKKMAVTNTASNRISLEAWNEEKQDYEELATFTLRSIIAKRYAKRKAKKVRK